MSKIFSKLMILFLFVSFSLSAQSIKWQNLDTIKAQKFDAGKMWTFDYPPVDYWKDTYGFAPSQEWLDKARLAAVRFATWCSSSFVSADGLIMTNHHCVDQVLDKFQKEGEDIGRDGFFAPTLADERKIPGLYVEQLIKIDDITKEIVDALNSGKTQEEKLKLKNDKIAQLRKDYGTKYPGMTLQVVQFYNGGKYSMYVYKRYSDIRAVYMNERDLGLFGGDPDNFTYPRYDADFAFVRAYGEDGKPLKTPNFFKFSEKGPQPGEPLFVIGNPGSTQRLKTVAQLEYFRDIDFPNNVAMYKGLFNIYTELAKEYPEKAEYYNDQAFFMGNGAKSMNGSLDGLRQPEFMARKKDFEKKFKAAVFANPELQAKYGHLWAGIEDTRNELRKFALEMNGYTIRLSQYFGNAVMLYNLAKKGPMPTGDELNNTINRMFPKTFDKVMQDKYLKLQIELIELNLGKDNELVKKVFGNSTIENAVKYILNMSRMVTKEGALELAKQGSEAILNSNDPLLVFARETVDKLADMRKRSAEITKTEQVMEEELGQALFAVYGTNIPPDATFTLRISDGVMQGYHYNGTVAPDFTTFYGMYDRYYSHRQQYPWALPERWAHPLKGLDMSAMYNFVTTNDVVGGNSGSPMINKNLEAVGAIFDGNIESLSGDFIYDTTSNRTVSVSSPGILQILYNITNAKRIAAELKAGKIVN